MKNNLLSTTLTWVLATSLLFGLFFSVQFYFRTKQLRTKSAILQQDLSRLQNNRNLINYLVTDVAEYGKTHTAMDPILASVGVKINRSNSAGSKP